MSEVEDKPARLDAIGPPMDSGKGKASLETYVGPDPDSQGGKALAKRAITSPAPPITPEIVKPVDPRGELFFSRYSEDNSLRLYKKGSMLGEDPAGYSDQQVVVKVMVKRPREQFMVIIPTTRMFLDQPGAEAQLAEIAWAWRHGSDKY